MKKAFSLCLLSLCLSLWACQTMPVHEAQPEFVLKEETPLAFALLPMAWDGQQFWQLVNAEDVKGLLAQDPVSKKAWNIPLEEALPRHKSLSFGQGQLWALDNNNTLYEISREGKVLRQIKPEFPEISGAEQVVWLKDELWVLHRSFLSAEAGHQRSRLYRLDPQNGKILETLIVDSDDFEIFYHHNLAADENAFYVVETSQFVPNNNRVYRILREDAAVQTRALERVFSGVQSLFFYEQKLYGIELQEQSLNCGLRCQGVLQELPIPGP